MICGILECFSLAVARTNEGRHLCNECALRMMGKFGPSNLTTLPSATFPWDHPAWGNCPNCGMEYNKYLIGRTGDCPACRKVLPEFEKEKKTIPLDESWKEADVKYGEGPHD